MATVAEGESEGEAGPATPSGYAVYRFPPLFVTAMAFIMAVIIVLAVVGNAMVIAIIWKRRAMRTGTNLFLASLSVANLLTALCTMPVALTTIVMGTWVLGGAFCYVNAFMVGLTFMASIHTLMWMSVQKCLSISRPLSRPFTKKQIALTLVFAWGWPVAYNLSPLFGWTEILYKRGSTQCGPSVPRNSRQYVHSLCNTLFNFLIPLVVMGACYTTIFRKVHAHLRRMRANTNMDSGRTVVQQKRIAITLVIVMAVFLVCWAPYIAYSIWLTVREASVYPIANPVVYWCGYINSAITPIIYALRSSSFRGGYAAILCCRRNDINASNSLYCSERSTSTLLRPYQVASKASRGRN